MAVDDPDEIERAAAAIAAAVGRLGQEEGKVRSIIASLPLRSTDPGGRTSGEVKNACAQILKARTTLEDSAKAMRRVAQELRNQRIR